MFAAASSLTTTTTTISSSRGGKGKEVVQNPTKVNLVSKLMHHRQSRSSMRRRSDVVVRAEAQKTIDMNEVSFTKIDSFIVFVALLCRCFLYSFRWKRGPFFFFFVFFFWDPSSGRMGRKISSKSDKMSDTLKDYFLDTRIMFCGQNRNFSLSLFW